MRFQVFLDIIVTLLIHFDNYRCQNVYEICQIVSYLGQNNHDKIEKNSFTPRIKEFMDYSKLSIPAFIRSSPHQ